jgi:hypothetical protein
MVVGQTISIPLSQSWTNATIASISFETQRPNDGHWTKRPALWYDSQTGQVYQWGGWPLRKNDPAALWSFTPGSYGTVNWTQVETPVTNEVDHTSPALADSAFVASDSALYSLGGNLAETYSNPLVALQGFLEYNFTTEAWTNGSSLPATPSGFLVGGGAVYAPEYGSAGFLIFVGGTAPDSQVFPDDGTQLVDMSVITLYDIAKGLWYHQTATGTIPPPRRFFCLVGGSSKEGSFEM